MKTSTKIWIGIIVLIVVIIFLQFSLTGNAVKDENIKIGFSGVLTGEAVIYGQSGLAATELAVNEQNANGGINGMKIELIVEDDKLSSFESVNIFNKFINLDNVDAIIITSGSGPTAAAVPISQANEIPTIVTIGSAPKITKTGDYIFRTYPSDSIQGDYGAGVIFNELGKKKVAMIYVKNDWGEGIKDVFKDKYEGLGGELVYESGVLQSEDDFRTEITKVKQSGAEALYIPLYPINLVAILNQAKEMNLDIPMLGADASDGDQGVLDVGEGYMYTVVKVDSSEEFRSKLRAIKGFENLNPNVAAPVSYDGAKILFLAIEKVGTDPQKLRDELAKTSYQGISNFIEFDENGDLKNAHFETKIIKNKEAIHFI